MSKKPSPWAKYAKTGSRREGKNPRALGLNKRALRRREKIFKANPDTFYSSPAWLRLRYEILVASNAKCFCCGYGTLNGKRLHVDHIKPRSKYPELELEKTNLQVLCEECNMGKGARDETDWRS